jgi:hypothetical protein
MPALCCCVLVLFNARTDRCDDHLPGYCFVYSKIRLALAECIQGWICLFACLLVCLFVFFVCFLFKFFLLLLLLLLLLPCIYKFSSLQFISFLGVGEHGYRWSQVLRPSVSFRTCLISLTYILPGEQMEMSCSCS